MSGKRRADAPAGGPARRRGRASSSGARRPRLRRVLKWLALLGLVGFLLLAGAAVVIYQSVSLPKANAEFETETSFIYYAGGSEELGTFAVQNRERIALDQMPQDVKDAVVAIENPTFWTDNGIDPKGIVRAAFNNAQGGETQGGSTITQQYVKVLYLNQERSYTRKIKEAVLALKVQRTQSKNQILEGYLNTIYFGNGSYGVQAAAKSYFQKPASELDLRESAALAAVLNNPSLFDPYEKDSKKRLRDRYRIVLEQMTKQGDLSSEEADRAGRRLPRFPDSEAESAYGGQKGHVLAMVKDELLTLRDRDGVPFTEQMIDGGGLDVTTTFTRKAMDAAEQGVAEARPEMNPTATENLHVGAASVEPGTGAVRGIYGGQDYLDSQINWAVAGGQAGSILKPFALTAALKDGYSLTDTFDGNSPIDVAGTEFANQGDDDYGTVSLITATENSINTAFVDLTDSMENGPQKIVDEMNAMGIPPSPDQASPDGPGLPNSTPGLEPTAGVALGSATVSPVNMANGYATIASGGVTAAPYVVEKVTARDGTVLYEHQDETTQAIDEEAGGDIAADVTYAMQQVVQSGSGTAALDLDRPAAGKTGTSTNDDGDVVSSWFAGFTPQLSTAVVYVRGKGAERLDGWLPDDDGFGDGYFGGTYPAQTWTAIMQRDMAGVDEEDFPEPAYVDIDDEDDSSTPSYAPAPRTSQAPAPRPTKQPTQQPTKKPTKKPTKNPAPAPIPIPTPEPPAPAPTAPSEPQPGCSIFASCSTPPPEQPPAAAAGRRAAD